jgi:hypothetical protein
MSDPWADEGFGGEDDWEGRESIESDLEDEGDGDDEAEPDSGDDD